MRYVRIPILAILCWTLVVSHARGQVGTWAATGSLNTARYDQRGTLLANGKVLVVGGLTNSGPLASSELYDPTTGMWTPTGSLGAARNGHTATLLADGRVLVAGGYNGDTDSGFLASAELYDPGTGMWTPTGSLSQARYGHTATLLANGEVLVAGGNSTGSDGGNLASAELYDPSTGMWAPTGSFNTPRSVHAAVLLPNGQVLVAGGVSNAGWSLTSSELYDPGTGMWTDTGSLSAGRYTFTATLLQNGKVLVAGGNDNNSVTQSAELYDPSTGMWIPTGSLGTARELYSATLLPSGEVLVAGGANFAALSSAELYDPSTGMWMPTGSLNETRLYPTAALLPSGKVLIVGGSGDNGILASAELYTVQACSTTVIGVTGPSSPLPLGGLASVTANFIDTRTSDTSTCSINWGDTTSSPGTMSESGGRGACTGYHQYTTTGVYAVNVTVTDTCAAKGSGIFQFVVVYDPNGGFVTGGGWINSLAGAYPSNPALAGKATFGFVSRYQHGATVPTGNTEFNFSMAGFDFQSAVYEWLVISGAKARYRGTGMVNGTGSYGFELTAWDGQVSGGGGVDRFRIKIWDQNQGNAVVYDNQMGAPDGTDPTTALGGGSIVIHQ